MLSALDSPEIDLHQPPLANPGDPWANPGESKEIWFYQSHILVFLKQICQSYQICQILLKGVIFMPST